MAEKLNIINIQIIFEFKSIISIKKKKKAFGFSPDALSKISLMHLYSEQ